MVNWDNFWRNPARSYIKIMNASAFDYVNNLKSDVSLNDSQIVLDYGAGTGSVSRQILKYVKSINVYDKSPSMTLKLKHLFSDNSTVQVLNELEDINEKIDLVLISSVIQYIDRQDLSLIIQKLQKISNKKHQIVISDIIPVNSNKTLESILMIKKSIALKVFLPYLWQMLTITLMILRRSKIKLTEYNEADLIKLFNNFGYEVQILTRNLGLSEQRYSIVCSHNGIKSKI